MDLALNTKASLPERRTFSESRLGLFSKKLLIKPSRTRLQHSSLAAPDHIRQNSRQHTTPITAPSHTKQTSLSYTPLAAGRIRLLRIVATTSDQIAVSLEEVELHDDVAYECLSYTWDGPKRDDVGDYWTMNRQMIVCNGEATYIRQNLYDALVQLRDLDILGPIWIDALCINQYDISERNSQVGRMGEIFKGATRVVIWLGKEDENTKPALEYLQRSNLTAEAYYKENSVGFREYRRCNYTNEEDRTLLCFFFERRWYSRLWVVQETMLARDLIFLCGSHAAQLETIWRGSLFTEYSHRLWDGFDFKVEVNNFFEIVMSRRDRLRTPTLKPIGQNIHLFRNAKASDPRDKVFGLLGISDCHASRISTTLVADYNMTVQQVYTKAALFSMCHFDNLSTLASVGNQSFNKINLPSWVPDLSVVERPSSFEYETSLFSTATGEPYSIEWDEDTLILQGYLLDRISLSSESSEDIYDGHGVSRLLQVFNASGSVYVHTNEPLSSAMQGVFIANQLSDASLELFAMIDGEYDMDGAFEKLFFGIVCFAFHVAGQMETLERFLDEPGHILRTLNKDTEASSECEALASILKCGKLKWADSASKWMSDTDFKSMRMLEVLEGDEDPFARSWYSMFDFRRYFRTDRGYLGLGLHHIRPGDGIYLIKGGSVPYVFRPVSENLADGFKLVGEVYLHGVMHGEALSKGPIKFERMEIH